MGSVSRVSVSMMKLMWHLPSETETHHFLTRTKVHLRPLMEWRRGNPRGWRTRTSVQKPSASHVTDSYPFAQAYPLCFPWSSSSKSSLRKPAQARHQSPLQFCRSQKSSGIYKWLNLLMFSMWYVVMVANVFGQLSPQIFLSALRQRTSRAPTRYTSNKAHSIKA